MQTKEKYISYNVNLHNAIDDLTNFVRFLFKIGKGPHIGCGFICFYGCKVLYISLGITP